MESKLKGRLLIRNSNAYVHDGGHEIPIYAWLCSFGLKDKYIEITLTREENKIEVRGIDEDN